MRKRRDRMQIDLGSLYSHTVDKLTVDTDVSYSRDDVSGTKIKDLVDVHVKGYFFLDSNNAVEANLDYSGTMILEDDISLEEVKYPFSAKISEKLEENQENFNKNLDLKEILWENIVLEIPLKFTKVQNFEEFNGDGWKLVSEDNLTGKDNPFKDLLNDFKEE